MTVEFGEDCDCNGPCPEIDDDWTSVYAEFSDEEYEITGDGIDEDWDPADDEVGEFTCEGNQVTLCDDSDDECTEADYEIHGDNLTFTVEDSEEDCTLTIEMNFEINADSDDDGDCSDEIIGKWNGLTFDIDYTSAACTDTDVENFDISETLFDFNSDFSYDWEGNNNQFIEDEEGLWSCEDGEIDICETGEDCASWNYVINGDQATIILELEEGGCEFTVTISIERD